jgi:hypothetical protein
MYTEELITKAETIVLAKHPRGIVGQVSEIYILTTLGTWVCRPFMVKDKEQSRVNGAIVRELIRALHNHRALSGVVQVSTGWIIPGLPPTERVPNPLKYKNREEVLLFNGNGETGAKIRVYKLKKVGRLKLASTLMGTFDDLPGCQRGG